MQRRAFTIIELLVTLSIIGLLLAMGAIGYGNAKSSSRDSQRISDIFTISNAFDQAAALNHGVYPNNAWPPNPSHRMCANATIKITDTVTTTNNIDLSMFKENTKPYDASNPDDRTRSPIPYDPKTALAARDITCQSYQHGYTYHTHYTTGDPSVDDESLAMFHNSTWNEGYAYILEFGLENPRPTDQTALVDQSFLGVTPGATDRYVYYLLGRFCGDKCY